MARNRAMYSAVRLARPDFIKRTLVLFNGRVQKRQGNCRASEAARQVTRSPGGEAGDGTSVSIPRRMDDYWSPPFWQPFGQKYDPIKMNISFCVLSPPVMLQASQNPSLAPSLESQTRSSPTPLQGAPTLPETQAIGLQSPIVF